MGKAWEEREGKGYKGRFKKGQNPLFRNAFPEKEKSVEDQGSENQSLILF